MSDGQQVFQATEAPVDATGTTPPAPHARAGRARAMSREDRRAGIITAATPLLRARGHDVTTQEIAAAAGIAEGTIFRAFGSKQELMDAVVEHALDVAESIGRLRSIDRSDPLDDRIRQCITIVRDRFESVTDLMIKLGMHGPARHLWRNARSGPHPDPSAAQRHGRAEHRQTQQRILEAIADVLAPDADRLSCPPVRAAHLLRLMVFSGAHHVINLEDPLTTDEIADVILHGVLRPERPFRPTSPDREDAPC